MNHARQVAWVHWYGLNEFTNLTAYCFTALEGNNLSVF